MIDFNPDTSESLALKPAHMVLKCTYDKQSYIG